MTNHQLLKEIQDFPHPITLKFLFNLKFLIELLNFQSLSILFVILLGAPSLDHFSVSWYSNHGVSISTKDSPTKPTPSELSPLSLHFTRLSGVRDDVKVHLTIRSTCCYRTRGVCPMRMKRDLEIPSEPIKCKLNRVSGVSMG